MIRKVLNIVLYTAWLLKTGGLRVFFLQLKRQLYSQDTLIGFEKTVDMNGAQVSCRLPYVLRKASEQEMDEVWSGALTESQESIHELMQRKWFYRSGFHDCYIARTMATGEPCCIAWLISTEDNDLVTKEFKSRLPVIKKGELLIENCYTFEKYRGNSIMPSVIFELWETAKARGYQRLVTYIRQDNDASLRAFEKLAFRKFEEVPELKLLFSTKRKHR